MALPKCKTPAERANAHRGDVEGSGHELATPGRYTEAVSDEDWSAVIDALISLPSGDSEQEVRARRAVHVLLDTPFIPRPMWDAAQGVAWAFCAAVLSSDPDLRRRANGVVGDALRIASEAQESLGRAA